MNEDYKPKLNLNFVKLPLYSLARRSLALPYIIEQDYSLKGEKPGKMANYQQYKFFLYLLARAQSAKTRSIKIGVSEYLHYAGKSRNGNVYKLIDAAIERFLNYRIEYYKSFYYDRTDTEADERFCIFDSAKRSRNKVAAVFNLRFWQACESKYSRMYDHKHIHDAKIARMYELLLAKFKYSTEWRVGAGKLSTRLALADKNTKKLCELIAGTMQDLRDLGERFCHAEYFVDDGPNKKTMFLFTPNEQRFVSPTNNNQSPLGTEGKEQSQSITNTGSAVNESLREIAKLSNLNQPNKQKENGGISEQRIETVGDSRFQHTKSSNKFGIDSGPGVNQAAIFPTEQEQDEQRRRENRIARKQRDKCDVGGIDGVMHGLLKPDMQTTIDTINAGGQISPPKTITESAEYKAEKRNSAEQDIQELFAKVPQQYRDDNIYSAIKRYYHEKGVAYVDKNILHARKSGPFSDEKPFARTLGASLKHNWAGNGQRNNNDVEQHKLKQAFYPALNEYISRLEGEEKEQFKRRRDDNLLGLYVSTDYYTVFLRYLAQELSMNGDDFTRLPLHSDEEMMEYIRTACRGVN